MLDYNLFPKSVRDSEIAFYKTKSNLYGLPLSAGNAWAMARGAPIELTYGEIRPQIFQSRVATTAVAWTIGFKRAYYDGMASRSMVQPGNAAARAGAATRAGAMANGSARIGTETVGVAAPNQAPGTVQPLGVNAVLRLYVPQRDLASYRPSTEPFGNHDMIFHSPTIFERLSAMVGR